MTMFAMSCINWFLLTICLGFLFYGVGAFLDGRWLAGLISILAIFATGTIGGLIMSGGKWR